MGNSLRSIVRSNLQEKSLKNFLGDRFDSTTDEEKHRFLKEVDEMIEMRTDEILNAFIEDVRKGSQESKKRRKRSYLVAATSILGTIGVTVTVEQENWLLTSIIGVILLLVQGYNISEEF